MSEMINDVFVSGDRLLPNREAESAGNSIIHDFDRRKRPRGRGLIEDVSFCVGDVAHVSRESGVCSSRWVCCSQEPVGPRESFRKLLGFDVFA